MKELRIELNRLQSDFEQKWSSQIKMVIIYYILKIKNFYSRFQVDANNRSIFKMNDKMAMLTDWFRSLGMFLK
jgi:hypothetical protein